MAFPEQQKQLQALSDDYTSLQNELQTTVAARQKLESQQQENKGVKSEFANLDDDANIYKLVGPILLKQDVSEAKSTVDGRLEFIQNEMPQQPHRKANLRYSRKERGKEDGCKFLHRWYIDLTFEADMFLQVFQLQTDIQQTGQA
ncbi:hypothetical protein E4T39_06355 [Aureobasidium subglaciale]|nr:hypothetical protein E4T39_06355 [Aureobasidium subglaciale]